MDIAKFNKELKTRVALARGLEKRNEIDSAITLWLEISEITLKYSKSRGIDATYKIMLINKTKGILEHVKNLKAGQVEKILFEEEEEAYIQDEEIQKAETSEIIEKENVYLEKKEKKGIRPSEPVQKNETEIEEEPNFKNIPKGFKEIKTSTDFKIVTPHDGNYVKKHLSQEENPSQQQKILPEQNRFEFDQPEDSEQLICFACGYDKNIKDAKICGSCGTKLN